MNELQKATSDYIRICKDIGLSNKLVIDDLKHIAFWYNYYAATIKSIANNQKPILLKGTYKIINEKSQKDFKNVSAEQLLATIKNARLQIKQHAPFIKLDEQIPYKQGSRKYSRDEYVETIANHLYMHIRYLKQELKSKQDNKS